MKKQLTQEEILLVQAMREVYRRTNNREISFQRASDVLELVDTIISIASGTFVCPKCRGEQILYVIRK